MSRGNDNGLGPCVDERARWPTRCAPTRSCRSTPTADRPTGRGFHVHYSSPPLNEVQAGPSVQFAQIMRDQLQASGIPPSNYIGQGGLNPRADMAGLNLAQFPSILVETGQHEEPRRLGSDRIPEGRQKIRRAPWCGASSGFLATAPGGDAHAKGQPNLGRRTSNVPSSSFFRFSSTSA